MVLSRHLHGETEENYGKFSEINGCPVRDSNKTPPECKSKTFNLEPTYWAISYCF
jgi:hypothetical protein